MATSTEASSASCFCTIIVAGDPDAAVATGENLVHLPSVMTLSFKFPNSPILGAIEMADAASATAAGESPALFPLTA